MSQQGNTNSRKRNREKESRRTILILGIAAVIVLLVLIAAIIRVKLNRVSEISQTDKTKEKTETVEENIKEPAAADELQKESGTDRDSNGNYGTESAGNADAAAEDTAIESQGAEEESSEEAADAPLEKYLADFDMYRVGDIIPEDKIDMEDLSKYFVAYEIKPEGNVFKRINGKSYVDNNNIALADLRYIQMPFYNFDDNVQLGELIVNKKIADDIIAIFKELFLSRYQIEKMELIDNYWTGDGDSSDSNSIDHNNTSAFCYRTATGSGNLSRHALGMAIDINPQQNPYVSYSSGQPKWSHANANDYVARDTGLPHVITHDDTAYKLFKKYGFTWGGDWNNPKDYQHFEMR